MVSAAPSRRAVLRAGLCGITYGSLIACTAEEARPAPVEPSLPPPPPDPDVALVDAALSTSRRLLDQATAAGATHPDLAGRLDPVVAVHRAHVAALDATPDSGSAATTSAPAPLPPAPETTLAGLAAAEEAAAGEGAANLDSASATTARLLASVTAAQATVATSLGAAPPTLGAPPTGSAYLQPALAAQHAAVFGYGAAGPWLGPEREPAARTAYAAHLACRDDLAAAVAAAGLTPEPALRSYDLPVRVVDEGSAVALLLGVEDGLADVWADVVAGTEATIRTYAALALQECAVRAAGWRGAPEPFPGMPERSA